ncbi:glycosyltransferase [Paludicola sp. MB14-C6]|uniref:glycosyltransferase n=1 Tax=Paludihabitans sp. MB14-C6 TaxID=3070656 RepID=UPI0027DDD68E|nr:glycosyltransferase [Paludicola sp. MB14-C6]WMJ22213.1 glycosyltransferase [Paludicola sp. MB14-C6]
MHNQILYNIGLALVILYLFMGIDDFIWDIYTSFKIVVRKNKDIDLNKVSNTPCKLLAVTIAAWHEENVLEDVVGNFVRSTIYPKSMYHIFLGVYPNDIATIDVARRLAAKYDNVHVIINCLPGPTSKAQNINYVIKQIFEFEKDKNWIFSSFTVHDSEDVVHPYELKVTNYLIEKYPALQFPVFPIIYKPTFKNFFKTITTGTYADEFAENHFLVMTNRNNAEAFVPSAGTGFALSRQVVESFNGEDILENGSLTEDYKLSLTLYQQKYKLYYVLEKIPRVTDDYKIVWDYIATRSIFPNTFKAAVRQKTRWITGITMQSLKFMDIFKSKGMSFVGKYSLYKDQKAKFGNLLAFVGYPVFIYFLISLFVDLPTIYPKYTFSWYMCLIVTAFMIERQIFRAIAIYNIYGKRSTFFACLFPPIIPFRIVWGNVINFTSTIKAYKRKYFGDPKPKNKQDKAKQLSKNTRQLKWDKTDHSFLSENVLIKYHRKIGDILLENKFICPKELQRYLNDIELSGKKTPLGEYLINAGIITEDELLICIADTLNKVYLKTHDFSEYNITGLKNVFSEDDLHGYNIIPIIKTDNALIVAISVHTPFNIVEAIQIKYNIKIEICFASISSIHNGLILFDKDTMKTGESSPSLQLFNLNIINYEQVLLIKNTAYSLLINEWDAISLCGIDIFKIQKSLLKQPLIV